MLTELFKGFSKLNYVDRLQALKKAGVLNADEITYLANGGLQTIDLGEKFIENVLGYFQIPMGVATNFNVDGKNYVIPMAVEETSIVAAASKTAKWVREHGDITTEVVGSDIIGQIQFAKVKSPEDFKKQILQQKSYLIELANREVAFGLVNRGGGVKDLTVRIIDREDGYYMGVVHIMMDPCDAMGANIINQVCEFLKHPLEQFTSEKVTMCILSNLVDTKLTKATVRMKNVDPELALKIEEASRFAELDPYRAATNNKGVLNGIDPILIATGNDWRAVEAGIHAFAARDGRYKSITKWRAAGTELVGEFVAPLVVGTVGGVTALHPTAKLGLKILGVNSASELSRIIASVGLVQNLGALRALTTVGIIEGHMKLHIKNLSLGAGATEKEMPFVVKKLEEILALRKRISLANAVEVLNDLRKKSEI
ncbi:hydroxymethylglutaryl-CoA reductase, degradative [Pseudobdellovibrio sp. HCB154]|uniref:hydroxymethylglutaryl-CoA reductase, degradative n=1 Tax=Pseudobdellovibrio sp. HCB154 TaxID=3386277 RepID=UPI00391707CE